MTETPAGADVSRNAVGQLRFFQALAGLLALLLVAGGAYFFYRQRQVRPVQILVSGRPVTTVENLADARSLLQSVRATEAGQGFVQSDDPRFKQTVELERVSDASPIDTDDTARTKLSSALTVTVAADVILISGKPFVALPDQESAQATLDSVRSHYANMPPNDPVVDRPTFREKVEIVRERVPVSLTKPSAQDAAPLLWTPPPARTYTVQPHETGWSIARKFNMQFADFIRANAGRDINHLAPGDTVAVSQTYPPLTVIVKKRSEKDEAIVPGAAAENAGLRQITLVTTYVNGAPEGPGEATNIYTIRRARPRSVLD